MAGKKFNLKKFGHLAKLRKEQLHEIKGGYKRIPGADESLGLINWDNIDVRSNGEFSRERSELARSRRLNS